MRSLGSRTQGLLRTASVVIGLTIATLATASAGTVTFTWNPSATGNSSVGPFTADNFDLGDFATIKLPSNPSGLGSVSESGFLLPTSFLDNTATVSSANVKGTWGIYEAFTATSHLSACSGGLCGAFDSVTASVYVYSTAKGVASVTFPGTIPTIHLPKNANPVLVATESGPISGTPNLVQIIGGVPNATVGTLFTPNAAEAGFFVNPTASTLLDLEQAFTNTVGVITKVGGKPCTTVGFPCTYEIKAGGGNGDFFRVPEPGTLSILGVSLTALGLVRRRRI